MTKQGRFLDWCEWAGVALLLAVLALLLDRTRSEPRNAEPPSAAAAQPAVALEGIPVREELRIRELERLLEEARAREAALQAREQSLQRRIEEYRQALETERSRRAQLESQSEIRVAKAVLGQELADFKASFLNEQLDRLEQTRQSDRVYYGERIRELESRGDELYFRLVEQPRQLERELESAHTRIAVLLQENQRLSARNDYLTAKVSELSQSVSRLNRHIDYLTTRVSY
jgi:chromosome segregation ATPase